MNQFETCPLQYQAERILRTAPRSENAQSIWGNKVHEAIEQRLQNGVILNESFEKYEKVVQVIERQKGSLFVEMELAVDVKFNPVAWDAPDMWVRGIIDVLVVDGAKAYAYDWKTGKVKEDTMQLQLFSLMVFAHFPEVATVITKYVWLAYNRITSDTFYRYDMNWTPFVKKHAVMQEAFETDIWPVRPSGLCLKHCNNRDCEYFEKGRSYR